VRNNSGHTLDFGPPDNPGGFVRLEVRDSRGRQLDVKHLPSVDPASRGVTTPRFGVFNVANDLNLPPGASRTMVVAVNDFFNLTTEGYYEVTARVGHERLSHHHLSLPQRIKVQGGVVEWERDVGVPAAEAGQSIAERKVSVLSFQADQSQIYCLRIVDDKYVYTCTRLAPRVRGVIPQFEVDARSQVHLFIQTQPQLFSHWVYDMQGERKEEAHYIVDQALPIPRLVRDPDIGRVMVVGGRRAKRGVDFNEVELPVMEAQEISAVPAEARGK